MTIGIDPLINFVCEMLLGSPEHPKITLHFLNAVLRGNPWITDVEIVNPIVGKEFKMETLDELATLEAKLGYR